MHGGLDYFDQQLLQKIQTEVPKVIYTEVVDLLILYNFYKGCMAFFSTIVHKLQEKFVVFWAPVNSNLRR
jgi:hypothetical protein